MTITPKLLVLTSTLVWICSSSAIDAQNSSETPKKNAESTIVMDPAFGTGDKNEAGSTNLKSRARVGAAMLLSPGVKLGPGSAIQHRSANIMFMTIDAKTGKPFVLQPPLALESGPKAGTSAIPLLKGENTSLQSKTEMPPWDFTPKEEIEDPRPFKMPPSMKAPVHDWIY